MQEKYLALNSFYSQTVEGRPLRKLLNVTKDNCVNH